MSIVSLNMNLLYSIFNFFVFLFGLCVGSFLNCVIYRLEKEENVKGRSYCPHCKHTLFWLDLIPVISFIFLKGKCRYCPDYIEDPRQSRDHKKISIQYPIIEIITGLLFLLIFNQSTISFGEVVLGRAPIGIGALVFNSINLLFLCYISSVFIVIFVYDLKHYLIPDKVLFPAIAVAFLYRLFYFSSAQNYLWAVLITAGLFLFIFLASRGKWMGFGDVKLAVLLGLLLGFPNILVGLFLSFLFGAIIGVALMLLSPSTSSGQAKIGLKSEIPFAPFLIAGTFAAMLWGQEIINWYAGFFM